MNQTDAEKIVEKALFFGASSAGIVRAVELKGCPSVRTSRGDDTWLRDGQSILVMGLEHSIREPELDWWGTEGGTRGNHFLRIISERLKSALARGYGIGARLLEYQPGDMGIYLKDAAVLAGLGAIGLNNLLITPRYGPRLRLRGLLLDADIPATKAAPFSPCGTCDMPCRRACPRDAFGSGSYDRSACLLQMQSDETNRREAEDPVSGTFSCIVYCRACELACPLGQGL